MQSPVKSLLAWLRSDTRDVCMTEVTTMFWREINRNEKQLGCKYKD